MSKPSNKKPAMPTILGLPIEPPAGYGLMDEMLDEFEHCDELGLHIGEQLVRKFRGCHIEG